MSSFEHFDATCMHAGKQTHQQQQKKRRAWPPGKIGPLLQRKGFSARRLLFDFQPPPCLEETYCAREVVEMQSGNVVGDASGRIDPHQVLLSKRDVAMEPFDMLHK